MTNIRNFAFPRQYRQFVESSAFDVFFVPKRLYIYPAEKDDS